MTFNYVTLIKKNYTSISCVNILVMNSFIECQNNRKELNVLDHSQGKQYGQRKNLTPIVLSSCHTTSITTPESKEEVENTEVRILSGFFTQATETVHSFYQALDYQSNGNCTCREMWSNTKQSKRNYIMQLMTYEQNQVMTKDLSVQFNSVTQSCLTLCDPMNRSSPGLPVHHQYPQHQEFTQTHAHRVGDAIQPSHPLSSPSPPAPKICSSK